MKAKVGDRIVIRGHRVGEHERDCEVLEVRGDRGAVSRALGRQRPRSPVLPGPRRRRRRIPAHAGLTSKGCTRGAVR